MAQFQRIALIGAQGYERESEDFRVVCFPWDKLNKISNIRDYDTVILNLLSLRTVEISNVEWWVFSKILNTSSMMEMLKPGGRIIVIGDPRLSVDRQSPAKKEEERSRIRAIKQAFVEPGVHTPILMPSEERSVLTPFLDWTGVIFNWDNQPGVSVIVDSDPCYDEYQNYLKNLRHWEYSLNSCKLKESVQFSKDQPGFTLKLNEDRFCRNRYGGALAFSINLVAMHQISGYGPDRMETLFEFGSVVFLPKTSLNEDETLMLILRALCGVDSEIPEPEWVARREAPGQKTIDDEISTIQANIESLYDDLHQAQAERENVRICLKLLYERGETLEEAVREIMRGIGAHVEDPQEKGKEDGWVTAQIGDEILEGVLEVKSTRNPQFDTGGIKQLLDWIGRGVELQKKRYKGIFVGSNAVDKPLGERPDPFSDDWRRSAELHDIVALKVEDLYVAHLLNAIGKLNVNEFWRRLFGTDGVFDSSSYSDLLASEENGGN